MGASDRTADDGRAPTDSDPPPTLRPQIGRIILAHEAPLRLGALCIEPALRRVAQEDGREEIVEPRVMQVLVALVRAEGKIVSRDDLLMSCWHGVVVGEDAIDRVIGRLRRLINGIGGGGFKLETITKVGYRLVSTDPQVQIEPADALQPMAATTERLLAVLAFDNLSGDADMAYFSDGVSEEILQTVGRAASVRVIGRSSCFQFRGADKNARHVAKELNATHVLDGSVRRSGPKVRVSAQLIECAGQTTLWSDRFDRDLSDVFALQDEIAGAVAAALKVAFAPPTAADVVDPAIYELFLRARARVSGFDPEQMVQTIKMVERVVAAAPKFAGAWSFLAACRGWFLRLHGEAARQYGLSREGVRTAAETALSLDAGLGRPYAALSLLEAWASFEEREALLRKALDVAPNDPMNLISMARFFSEVGRRREAAAYANRAYDLDPLDVAAADAYLTFLDHYDRDLWESACGRWPDNDVIAFDAIAIAADFGDWEGYDSFVAASRLRITNDPNFRALVWHTRNLRNPDPQSIGRAFERARQELSRTGTLPLSILTGLSQLGMTEEVFGLIDQASFAHVFDEAGPAPSGVFSPSIISSRSNMAMIRDIRFVGLCAKLGLCAYWVKTERWPDWVDEVAYDFRAEARLAADNGRAST
jgi:adenylate cyclase